MNITAELIQQIKDAPIGFASLTYRAKSTNELARYTVILGAKYDNLLTKSLMELEELILGITDPISVVAAQELKASIECSIEQREQGNQNPAYTKAGMYTPIANGLCYNDNDMSLQLFGLLQSKVVLEQGVHKKKNSSAKTIAKNRLREQLRLSKFREFALDIGNIQQIKINGNTIEIE